MEKDNRVFVSYSRADKDRVMEIVRTLERDTGLTFWMDLTGIESGSLFEDTIIQAIDRSEVVLFMLSDSFVSSPWTKREVYYAENQGKRVVPVSVDGKPAGGWAKFHFGSIDCIDSTSAEQMSKLVGDLRSWLGDTSPVDTAESADAAASSPSRLPRWGIPAGITAAVMILLTSLYPVLRKQPAVATGAVDQRNDAIEETVLPSTEGEHRGIAGGHAWVDLGSGVKWATSNLGADSPGLYGGYFSWGETAPKAGYTWGSYRLCTSSGQGSVSFSRYNTKGDKGMVDNRTQLSIQDDAARQAWGGSWRMPTKQEFEALLSVCTVTWTNRNGHDGCLLTSRTNGESIFLPASGCMMEESLRFVGQYGFYWSSTLNAEMPEVAWYLFFDADGARIGDRYRYAGRAIRPVMTD